MVQEAWKKTNISHMSCSLGLSLPHLRQKVASFFGMDGQDRVGWEDLGSSNLGVYEIRCRMVQNDLSRNFLEPVPGPLDTSCIGLKMSQV